MEMLGIRPRAESKVVGDGMGNVELPLVSERYREIADEITCATGRSSGPSLIVVSGPSGSGKTRIVREVYANLIAKQDEPHYWSPLSDSMPGSDTSLGLVTSRKIIGPDRRRFVWPIDAFPSFLWISVPATALGDGSLVSSIGLIEDQVELHSRAVIARAIRASGKTGALVREFKALTSGMGSELRDEAFSEVAGRALEALLGTAVPGAGLVVDATKKLWDQRIKNRTLLVEAATTSERNSGLKRTETVLDALLELGGLDTPIIIAVEDAHLIDSTTRRLFERLLETRSNVVILATAWPEGERRTEFSSLVRAMEDRRICSRFSLAPMADAELGEIVRQIYPRTDDNVVRDIAKRFVTPLAIQVFLSLDLIRRSAVNGELKISAAALSRFPMQLRGLYLERWNELDVEVQQGLIYALCSTVRAFAPKGSAEFLDSVIAETAARIGETSFNVEALEQARKRDQWIARGHITDNFREPLLVDIVEEALHEQLDEDAIRAVWRETMLVLSERFESGFDTQSPELENLFLASWWCALSDAMECETDNLVRRRASALAGIHKFSLGSMARAVELLFVAVDGSGALDAEPWELIEWRVHLVGALGAIGRVHKSLELGDSIRTDEIYVRDWTPQRRWNFDFEHGDRLRRAGRSSEADSMFAKLIDAAESDARVDSVRLIEARAMRALNAGQAGRAQEAAEALRVIAESDAMRYLAVSRQISLRRSRWRWAATAGNVAEACVHLARLLEFSREALGIWHRETMYVKSNLAYFEAQRGAYTRAVALYQELLDERRFSLGVLHAETVDTARNLCFARVDAGYEEDAEHEITKLFRSELATIEPLHPLVLSTRILGARKLAELGKWGAAMIHLDAVVNALLAQRDFLDPMASAEVMARIGEYGQVADTVKKVMTIRDLAASAGSEGAGVVVQAETLQALLSGLEVE